MSSRELNFYDIARRLQDAPASEPATDLWSRIEQAHLARRQRRRRQRLGAVAFAAAAGLAAALVLRVPGGAGPTDWEARAQALEIQLHAGVVPGESDNPFALDAKSELARVDRALQSAYDHGAGKSELVPLWKQRSELLSALLAARQQSFSVTRI